MALKLPAVALSLLKVAKGAVDPARRGTKAQLGAACKALGYPLHPSVVSFEAAFGGLVIANQSKAKQGGPVWLFGAHACLTSGAHVAPRGGSKRRGLVPVAYSPNDVIYFLDKQGRAFAQDTIEDTAATPFADNGAALVTRVLLYSALFALGDSAQAHPGLVGAELAKRLSLTWVKEASGRDLRFFSNATGKTLVIENIAGGETLVASADKKLLRALEQTEPKPANRAAKRAKPTAEEAPFAGKSSVRVVGEKRRELPDIFAQLTALTELDVSVNQLAKVPDSLWRAPKLRQLDLSHNPLRAISGAIADARELRALNLRGTKLEALPPELASANKLEKLLLDECAQLDVEAALPIIALLPRLKTLSLPLSSTLTTLAALAQSPVRELYLVGTGVKLAKRLPAGLSQIKNLTDLRIEYADGVAALPKSPADVRALRLLFNKRFTDADIRKSAAAQPKVKYLQTFVKTLSAPTQRR